MTDKEQAYQDYMSGMKYKDIASKLGISINTIKSWKKRHNWQRGAPPATKKEKHQKNAPQVAPPAIDQLDSNIQLTDKQKMFCVYYLTRFNATWAYMKAYDVTYNTAMVNGNRLLRNAYIKQQLAELKKAQETELYINATDILNEYVKQATSNLGDYLKYDVQEMVDKKHKDVHGNYERYYSVQIKPEDMDKVDMSLVKSFHRGKDGLVIELYDKQKAMQVLLDRLPEAKLTSEQKDSFLNAIIAAKKGKEKE
ncbi:terminase [Levilactobacillus brevis]|uniref:terminase small subunit n=1 Tax=Levilactobacillus brevis TaxID=1580 RepID=UPI0005A9E8B4|nr:terminase small subunit [Levilactobacillus brevis]RDF14231.1 terminase [Levilactobacillus brevis]